MIKTVIIEDELDAQKNLTSLIQANSTDINIVGYADSVSKGVELIKNEQPDLVFMDIEIKEGLSFEVLEQVDYSKFLVVFATGFDQFAIKAFKFSAVDYILKPYDEDDIAEALNKVNERLEHKNGTLVQTLLSNLKQEETKKKYIAINSIKSIERFAVTDILYCEAYRNYTTFHLANGESIVSSKSLKEYEEILEEDLFLRAHRSYIVNKDYITKFDKEDGGMLVLSNNAKVPVSQRKKELVMNSLFR